MVHSCTITGTAEKKSVQFARSIKKKYPGTVVVLAGCAVEADSGNNLARYGIDLLAGQTDKYRLPQLLKNRIKDHEQNSQAAQAGDHSSRTRALIKVQDGCNFKCAYCIVPSARGNPVSRPPDEIMTEISSMAEQGYREFVITGANMACYSWEDKSLVNLLHDIEKIEEVHRIRLSSIELSTAEKDIIDFIAQSSKTCNYIHLPLQSGDNDILESMGRRYNAAEYSAIVEYAAERIPRLGLGTDIITGFPGETEESFNNTLTLVRNLPFNNLHVFPYSKRPGTRAADYPHQVEIRKRKERCGRLIELGNEKRAMFAKSFVNVPVSVLVERNRNGVAKGWTKEYLEAEIRGPELQTNQVLEFTPSSCDGVILR